MAAIDLESLEQRHSTGIGILLGTVVVLGVIGLFIFDVTEPRGVVDGVGYAALVGLSVRYGGRAVIACAVITSILTVVAAFVLPDKGISVAGMWANRAFAIASIWIVAGVLLRRLQLEAFITIRERRLLNDQVALGKNVREALLADKSQIERIRYITELGAQTMQSDFAGVLQGTGVGGMIRALDVWDRHRGVHFDLPDVPLNDTPEFISYMESEFVVATDDILTSSTHRSRLEMFGKLGIRAILVADTFVHSPGLGSIAFAFREPHHWTTQEIAFARAVANQIALLFSASQNAETLATLDLVGEGIYTESADGALQYANRAAKALSKRCLNDLTPSFPRPTVPLAGASDMHEISYDGRDLEIQRMRLPDGGTLTRINDVTIRNAGIVERRQLESRLQQGAKMEAIGQLAGGIAHDFNNILGSILGFAGFLVQDLPPRSAEHGFAERILNACERGKDLVEQILAFARARTVERGVVDLGLLLKRSQSFLASLVSKKITLNISQDDCAMPVFGSAAQIDQLIANLCINARDALDGAAGVIDVTARLATTRELDHLKIGMQSPTERVFGDVQGGRSYCLLRVEDNGEGISPDILDRIFEPFFTTKGRHRSTGLGLAVVHGVVVSTGGLCHVRSSPGSTVFSVYFPIAVEPGVGTVPSGSEPSAMRGSERILIVDDERDIADMLAIGLERLGYETVGVDDPLEALAAFIENPQAFDVVITDQVMPGMRGLDLIRRLKEIRPEIKAVLCTGYSEGANAEVSREAGADVYFHKPVDARQIAVRIRALFKPHINGQQDL